jgi:hypothetical protein
MKEHLCEFQDSVFLTDKSIVLSRCLNPDCDRHFSIINQLICLECDKRQTPSSLSLKERASKLDKVPNIDLTERRETGKVLAILTTFCFKCKFYDKRNHTCSTCDCLAYEALEDKIKDISFQCPLKVW